MKSINGDFPIAVHPGDVLKEMLEELSLNQVALANHLKMDPAKINEICRRRRGVSVEMAVILGEAFRVSPGTWLNLQMNWDLSQIDRSKIKRVKPIKRAA